MRWSFPGRRVLSVIAGVASVLSLVVPVTQIPAGAASPTVGRSAGLDRVERWRAR